MFIDKFLLGVAATIIFEIVVLFIWAIVLDAREKRERKRRQKLHIHTGDE